MDLTEILSLAVSTLVVLVLAHLAVYWVVKTLYPPPPQVIYAPMPMAPMAPVAPAYTPPPSQEQQNVVLPTYETALPVETPRKEGNPPGKPLVDSNGAIQRPPELVAIDPRL